MPMAPWSASDTGTLSGPQVVVMAFGVAHVDGGITGTIVWIYRAGDPGATKTTPESKNTPHWGNW
jgi:hypothetical protein